MIAMGISKSSVLGSLQVTLRESIGRFADAYAAYRARRAIYRRTCSELGQLSDRDLADIGIPRSHVRRVALEAAQEVVRK